MNDIRPQGEILYDDHEVNANKFYDEYEKNKDNQNLLLKAAVEFELSTNPDGIKMAIMCRGMYFTEKGKKEMDDDKARKLFLKALKEFRKVAPNDIIVKQV